VVRIDGKKAGEFSLRRIAPECPSSIWMPQPIFLQALVDRARDPPSFPLLGEGSRHRAGARRTVAWSA
jgi:hypothetical protein